MRIAWLFMPLLLLLGACGDPLAGIERVSEGGVFPDEVATTALPTEAELAREESVLSGLFRKRADMAAPAATDASPIDAEASGTADATDLQGGLSRDIAAQASDTPARPGRRGLLGWLRGATVAENPSVSHEKGLDGTDAGADLDLATTGGTEEDALTEEARIAALAPDAVTATPPTGRVEPRRRRGLFARAAPAKTAGMAVKDTALGTALPFGDVARVCDVRAADLGKLVEQAARKGRGYKLYDSAPESAAPRSFYVTGFSDNCARQFTAALAIFGTPEFYEQLRYGVTAGQYPYSTTDRAYEKVKARMCNVGRNQPCGVRVSRLEKTTTFVSIYERFGEKARWADMLLHDGALLATSVKSP